MKKNILIIDDTPANLWLLTKLLQQHNYNVRPVTNGPMAVKSAISNPPDLILLDIIMPDMNGYEVCKIFKSYDDLREIPVIFLTAMTDAIDKVKAFAAGGVDYITKPFEPEEVLARINTHITICTQKKLLKESLENKYRNLFENAVNGIFQFQPNGKILTINPAFANIHGCGSPEEMLAEVKDHMENVFASREDYEKFLNLLNKPGRVEKFETQTLHKGNDSLWVSINARAVKSEGKRIYFEGFLEDITERKQAEEMLRRSEAEMRALLESMSDVVLAFNAEGVCVKAPETSANGAYKPPKGFVGRKLLDIFPGLSMDESLKTIGSALESRKPLSMEYYLDKTKRWFYAVITPMGENTALWVARDITEIKEANIALKVLLQNMEQSKKELENNICESFNSLVLPYLQNIKRLKLNDAQMRYMDTVEKNLGGIVSQFMKELKQYNLTPTEMEIANYTKEGRSSKEIADIMHISKGVVDIHRYRIRKKLGINNEKANLRAFLLALKT